MCMRGRKRIVHERDIYMVYEREREKKIVH